MKELKLLAGVLVVVAAAYGANEYYKKYKASKSSSAGEKKAVVPNSPEVPTQKEEFANANGEMPISVSKIRVKSGWGSGRYVKSIVGKNEPCPAGCNRYIGTGDSRICSCRVE